MILSFPSPFPPLPSPFSLLPSPFSLLPSPFSLLPSPFSLLPSPFSLYHFLLSVQGLFLAQVNKLHGNITGKTQQWLSCITCRCVYVCMCFFRERIALKSRKGVQKWKREAARSRARQMC